MIKRGTREEFYVLLVRGLEGHFRGVEGHYRGVEGHYRGVRDIKGM